MRKQFWLDYHIFLKMNTKVKKKKSLDIKIKFNKLNIDFKIIMIIFINQLKRMLYNIEIYIYVYFNYII